MRGELPGFEASGVSMNASDLKPGIIVWRSSSNGCSKSAESSAPTVRDRRQWVLNIRDEGRDTVMRQKDGKRKTLKRSAGVSGDVDSLTTELPTFWIGPVRWRIQRCADSPHGGWRFGGSVARGGPGGATSRLLPLAGLVALPRAHEGGQSARAPVL